jgi:hypothetical protein
MGSIVYLPGWTLCRARRSGLRRIDIHQTGAGRWPHYRIQTIVYAALLGEILMIRHGFRINATCWAAPSAVFPMHALLPAYKTG